MEKYLLEKTGLTRQQVQSQTASKIVDALIPDDANVLLLEAQRQVQEMQKIVWDQQREYGLPQKLVELHPC